MNSSLALLKRLLQEFLRPYYHKLALSILFMIIVALTAASHVALIKPAIDEVFLRQDKKMLVMLPIMVIIIAIIKAIAGYYENYLMRYIGQRVITDMQLKLYRHLLYADLAMLQAQASGNIISRFTNDIAIMRGAVSGLITGFVKELLTVVFLIALMFYQDFTLTIITFTVFPLAILPMLKTGKRMRKISHKTQEELGNYTARLDDSFSNIRIIKSYHRQEFEIKKANSITQNIFNLYIKAIKVESITSPVMEMIGGIAIALVIWYGGLQVISGKTTPGGFFAFITAFIAAYKPVKSLSSLNNNLQEGLAAAKRVFTILDTQPKIVEIANAQELKITNANIVFKDVDFFYANGKKALNNLSLEVPSGKTIALVGGSGGGKSTIINTILRLYDIEHGSILIDGYDIRNLTLSSLRANISLVSQDVILFDDSVLANIAYGKLDASREEVINAAKSALAHEFIQQLPQGYDTIIGQNGLILSGGQKQRITIARAMLKKSPILLLDEATSALDNVLEQDIQKSLELLSKNTTTIVIAHRLSTIIKADLIYVIRDGGVVACGKHEQLLDVCAEYQKLYHQKY
jgi:ATP-binding cassette, subfamily B, bacterial MsbA